MSNCSMLYASCHQKWENGGKKALRELYDIHERYWADNNHRPGDDWEGTKSIRAKFEKVLNNIQIKILVLLNPHYLNKYIKTQDSLE